MKTYADLSPADGYFYDHFRSKKTYDNMSDEEKPRTFEEGLESIALDYYFNTPDLFRSKPADWTGLEQYTYYFLDIVQKGAPWLSEEQIQKITDLKIKIADFCEINGVDLGGYCEDHNYNYYVHQDALKDIERRRFRRLRYADNLKDHYLSASNFFADHQFTK